MQTPRPINDPSSGLVTLVAIALAALLLIGQALFIVPAGKVAVVTGATSGSSDRHITATMKVALRRTARSAVAPVSMRCARPSPIKTLCFRCFKATDIKPERTALLDFGS